MALSRESITNNTRMDDVTKRGLMIAILMVAVSWIIWLWYQGRLPPEIPLWYSQPYGSNWLASKSQLILLPVLATGFLVFNALFIWWQRASQILNRFLAWSTVLVTFVLGLGLVHIIILVL